MEDSSSIFLTLRSIGGDRSKKYSRNLPPEEEKHTTLSCLRFIPPPLPLIAENTAITSLFAKITAITIKYSYYHGFFKDYEENE